MTPDPHDQLERVREKARELWGDAFTAKLTLWEDGDYRIVAYSQAVERHKGVIVGREYDELWWQSSEDTPPGEAVRVQTAQQGSAARTDALQSQVTPPERVELPGGGS